MGCHCSWFRRIGVLPKGVSLTGECKTLSLEKYKKLLKEKCPGPPRAWFFYNLEGELTRRYGFALEDLETGVFYTNTGSHVFECIISEGTRDKLLNRGRQVHCLDQYLREFQMGDSAEVFLHISAALHNEPKYNGCLHSWFYNCMCQDDDFTELDFVTQQLKPGWFPDRVAFVILLLRCLLNAFIILYFTVELATGNYAERNLIYLIISWSIQLVEGYLLLQQLCQVTHDFCAVTKRALVGDTTHFQCKNLAFNLEKMSAISVLRYMPSAETIGLLFRRKYELCNGCRADIQFAMHSRPRDCPRLVLLREAFELFLKCVMPFLALCALLTKVVSMPWIVNRGPGQWQWYHFVLYIGFVNQLAGLRSIKDIEIYAIENLMFSGANAKLDLEEHVMINSWWNFVLLSAVSNVSHLFTYPLLDSVIFWTMLTPRKLQLLSKNHDCEGSDIVEVKLSRRGVYKLVPKAGFVSRQRGRSAAKATHKQNLSELGALELGQRLDTEIVEDLEIIQENVDQSSFDAKFVVSSVELEAKAKAANVVLTEEGEEAVDVKTTSGVHRRTHSRSTSK